MTQVLTDPPRLGKFIVSEKFVNFMNFLLLSFKIIMGFVRRKYKQKIMDITKNMQ